jgi:hypothetical protein
MTQSSVTAATQNQIGLYLAVVQFFFTIYGVL